MKIPEHIRKFTKKVKKELQVYRLVLKDPGTPAAAKIMLWLAVTYLMLPFDIIPDFIPVIGQIDDLIIIPLLVYFALKIIPSGIVDNCRLKVNNNQ